MNRRAVFFLAFSHFVNDFLNGTIGGIMPLLTVHFHLTYLQVGLLIMTSNVASSLIQPLLGFISDKRGIPKLLPYSAIILVLGIASLPFVPSFPWLLPVVALSSIGSAVFHPDASRAVYFAAASKRGLAQSVFQIGGNSGMAASAVSLWFLGTVGLGGTLWFMLPAVISAVLLGSLVRWFSDRLREHREGRQRKTDIVAEDNRFGLTLLVAVVTVRSWITSGITTFVPLYVMHSYSVSAKSVWLYTFTFLAFGALGTIAGGPLADRYGQRTIIRLSMTASTPLALALPFLPQTWILADMALLGFFLLSTFAVTVVYGQEMLPSNIAMVSGLLIGFAGGLGGIGTLAMGYLADAHTLHTALVAVVCAMPVAAICTLKLPLDVARRRPPSQATPAHPQQAASS